jgi:hypothetical protein
LGIDPVVGRDLAGGRHGQEQLVGDVAEGEAGPGRALAVDVEVEPGRVQHLVEPHVHHARDDLELLHQGLGGRQVLRPLLPGDLDGDGRRDAEVDHLGHDVAGRVIEAELREPASQLLAKQLRVVAGGPGAVGLEADEQLAVGGRGVGRIRHGQGVAGRKTDLGEHLL